MHKQLPKSRARRRSPVRKGKDAVKAAGAEGVCGSLRAPQTVWLCVAVEHTSDADPQLGGPEGSGRPAGGQTRGCGDCCALADAIGRRVGLRRGQSAP